MAPFDKDLAEALCNLEVPRVIRFSPDGSRIAYSTSLSGLQQKDKHAVSTLWLANTVEEGSARQLTSGKTRDRSPAWHPDGNRIAFVSDRAKAGESSALYMLRLDGGDATPLTATENEQGISAFVMSPDGKTIAYLSPDEKSDEEKQKKKDEKPKDVDVWGEKWEHARLRLVDLETKEVRTLFSEDRHVVDLSYSPDGKTIAVGITANPEISEPMLSGTTVATVSVDSGEVKELCHVKMAAMSLKWAPDGKIYFISCLPEDKETGSMAVYSVDPTVASPHVKVGFGEDDYAFELRVIGDKLLVSRHVRVSAAISDLDGRDLFNIDVPIGIWDVHTKNGTPTLAASISSVSEPSEVVVIRDGKRTKLSQHGKALTGSTTFGTATTLTSQSSDGQVELDAIYFAPKDKAGQDGKPKEPLPTFVLVHGGPTSLAGADFHNCGMYWGVYLLARGYGVLMPNYRGSTGRGDKFGLYSYGGMGQYDYDDVISMTDDAIKRGYADSKSLIVGGWSQGGYMAYLCSARNGLHGKGWRFNATVAGAGICDWEALASTSDMGATYETELNGGHAPWTLDRDDTRIRKGSALWQVKNAVEESKRRGEPVIPPMLVLHGKNDVRCPLSQAEGYRRALRTYGLECEFVVYPDQGHNLKPQEYWLDVLERVERWSYTYIGEGKK